MASGAAMLRIARVAELAEGGRIVKEVHGRKIMVARAGGKLYATDAHCFHMGGNLWEGDIEDVGGHACVVCPNHRYRIDMSNGQKVERMLDGGISCSSTQQQRTYAVHADAEHIWVSIPELAPQQALPSDRYNQAAPPSAPANGTPGRTNFGLFGASSTSGSRAGAQPEALSPYGGFQQRGLVPGTPARGLGGDEPAMLSQDGIVLSQLSQEQEAAAQQQQQAVAQQQQQQQHMTPGRINFSQARAEPAHIARRKAATAAIAKRAYQPPTAPPIAPAPAAPAGVQQSLLSFGFTKQRQAVSTAPEAMDME